MCAAHGLMTQQARLRGCRMTSDAVLFWKQGQPELKVVPVEVLASKDGTGGV